jgi:hypothetical protein
MRNISRVIGSVLVMGLLLAGSLLVLGDDANAQEPKVATEFGEYRGSAELQVWVTDEYGNPRADVVVCLFHKSDCLKIQRTDNEGFTSFTGIANDETYKVQAGNNSETKKIDDNESVVIVHLAF